jgi:hypothetical protein
MASVLADIKRSIRRDTVIPKPEAQSGDYIVEELWGESRGEDALVYSIPSRTPGARRNRKRVRKSEWVQAAKHLTAAGDFRHSWFKQFMPECYNDGTCNFTAIGGFSHFSATRHITLAGCI